MTDLTSTRIAPASHGFAPDDVHPALLDSLDRLREAGYRAYLVGGCIRDKLLGIVPKDFDVVTDARPEQIKKLFGNSRIIGRRFKLVHLYFGRRHVVEVATFRAAEDGDERRANESGRIVRDNVYGDKLEDDVIRRDFTINALYCDSETFDLIDHVGAMDDLANRRLRLIGEPLSRCAEDPVRILRAARFAAKLGFDVDPETAIGMREKAFLLRDVPGARLYEEVLKLFQTGHGLESWRQLRNHGLLAYLMPVLDRLLEQSGGEVRNALVEQVLSNTDSRLAKGLSVTPGFLVSSFYWPEVLERAKRIDDSPELALAQAADECFAKAHPLAVPKRFTSMAREIWGLQPQLELHAFDEAIAPQLIAHPRFRAAYDFLELRSRVSERLSERARWWTEIQRKIPAPRRVPVQRGSGGSRRRRSRGPQNRSPDA